MELKPEITQEKRDYWIKRAIKRSESATKYVKVEMDEVSKNLEHVDSLSSDLQDAISKVHGAFTDLLIQLHKAETTKKEDHDENNTGDDKIASAVL